MIRSTRRRRTFQPGLESLSARITPTMFAPTSPLPVDPGIVMPDGSLEPTDTLVPLNSPTVCLSDATLYQPTDCTLMA